MPISRMFTLVAVVAFAAAVGTASSDAACSSELKLAANTVQSKPPASGSSQKQGGITTTRTGVTTNSRTGLPILRRK